MLLEEKSKCTFQSNHTGQPAQKKNLRKRISIELQHEKKNKLTFPNANKLLSNSNKTPKNKKKTPNPARPTPNSTKQKTLTITKTKLNPTRAYFEYRLFQTYSN